MANPRAQVSFRQLRPERDSFKADGTTIVYDSTKNNGSAAVGLAVSIAADKTVQLAADGQRIIGVVEHVEADLTTAIWVETYVSMPTVNGAGLAAGSRVVGALSGGNRGYVRAAVAATLADVFAACGTVICADASIPGNVIVMMD